MTAHLTESCVDEQPCRELYKEVVLLKSDYEAQLPQAIEAVFCRGQCDEARRVHAAFLAAYSLNASSVPLLRYDADDANGFIQMT